MKNIFEPTIQVSRLQDVNRHHRMDINTHRDWVTYIPDHVLEQVEAAIDSGNLKPPHNKIRTKQKRHSRLNTLYGKLRERLKRYHVHNH